MYQKNGTVGVVIFKVSLFNMSLYPKYDVYKILLEKSGLKKSVVISDLSLKPMSLNPKFTVLHLRDIS